ncbi:hypothetical protein C3L33_17040, partial [Rhododendron williamsianum]
MARGRRGGRCAAAVDLGAIRSVLFMKEEIRRGELNSEGVLHIHFWKIALQAACEGHTGIFPATERLLKNRLDETMLFLSSLAAARADNFYYPPEWTPKQGNLNKFHGQHALRERARKIDQGILIIRFEMPYNIWCGGCNSMIAKGVRFNAEKKQVGNYYSTKIWSFSMKSACCKHEIVIQTDPKNCEYVIISGAQKKTEDYDIEDAETLILPPDEERGKLADPFYRLEHGEKDMQKKKEAEPVLLLKKRLLPGKGALAKEKRALIKAASIFPGSSGPSTSNAKRMELESKRRKIKAAAASSLLVGGFKPSSWSQSAVSSGRQRRV